MDEFTVVTPAAGCLPPVIHAAAVPPGRAAGGADRAFLCGPRQAQRGHCRRWCPSPVPPRQTAAAGTLNRQQMCRRFSCASFAPAHSTSFPLQARPSYPVEARPRVRALHHFCPRFPNHLSTKMGGPPTLHVERRITDLNAVTDGPIEGQKFRSHRATDFDRGRIGHDFAHRVVSSDKLAQRDKPQGWKTLAAWTGPARPGGGNPSGASPAANQSSSEISSPPSRACPTQSPARPSDPADGCVRIARAWTGSRSRAASSSIEPRGLDDVEAGAPIIKARPQQVIDKPNRASSRNIHFEPRSMSVHAWPTAGTGIVLRIASATAGPTAGDDCPDGRVGESVEKQGT